MEDLLKVQLAEAIEIASHFHNGKRDKNNEIYILHPLRIMFQMETYEQKIVAILHDILEDTECTIEYLREKGFFNDVLDALVAITRNDGEKYIDYIRRVEENTLAAKVKIRDLIDNLSRKGAIASLRYRYCQALSILCSDEQFPSKKETIAEFCGIQVYIDRLWPEIEFLGVNYQDEAQLQFVLSREEFRELGEYTHIKSVFMEWYYEHKDEILRMMESGEYYLLPNWEE